MQFTKKCLYFFAAMLSGLSATAQSAGNLVGTLVAAENYFAANTREKGIKQGFLNALDEKAVVFRNGTAVNAVEFYTKIPDNKASLYWEPVYARVAKSGDWGFTTGPSIYRRSDTSAASYGDYFSVWLKNRKGVWKLAFDIGISHAKPQDQPKLNYVNPPSQRYFRQFGEKRQEQREDIVKSSDLLYASILKADNKIARKEFVNENCYLLFPGALPVSGKAQIESFWEKQQVQLTSEPIDGVRAFSGELAYTYGNAVLVSKGQSKKYHYLRVWELQPEFKWNVIAEVYVEAPN